MKSSVVGAMVLAVAILAGCSGGSGGSASSPGATSVSGARSNLQTGAVTGASPGVFDGYVALGDSYSSGEGAPPWDAGTNRFVPPGGALRLRQNGCHRSSSAWPRLLGADEHLACSGAVIADLSTGQERLPPDNRGQLSRLGDFAAGERVSLVTITMGGNDLGFARIVESCRLAALGCLNDLDGTEAPRLNELRAQLAEAYARVRAAAPGARVLVVGYPDIFPAPEETWAACGWMTAEEKLRVADLSAALESTLQRAAGDAQVEFLSVRDALDGHELCTRDSAVVPITAARLGSLGQDQAHPNTEGQRLIADVVAAYLDEVPGVVAGNEPQTRQVEIPLSTPRGYQYGLALSLGTPTFAAFLGDPGRIRLGVNPGWASVRVTNATADREAPVSDGAFRNTVEVVAFYRVPRELRDDVPLFVKADAFAGPGDEGAITLPIDGGLVLPDRTVAAADASPIEIDEARQQQWDDLFAAGPAYYVVVAEEDAFGNSEGDWECLLPRGDWLSIRGLVAVIRPDGALVGPDACDVAARLGFQASRLSMP